MAAVLNPQMQQQLLLGQQRVEQSHFGGKGKAGEQYQSYGIPGLTEALTETLGPVAHMDTSWTLEEMVKRVQSYLTKAAKKYEIDERTQKRATAVDAQAIIEEFVSSAMSAMSAGCYDKAWFSEADFTPALLVTAIYTFRGSKLFCRTLGPFLKRYVDNAVFRYREEERMAKVMWDAVSMSGLTESYHKRASKNLQSSYDEAHMAADYGRSAAATPEEGIIRDFIKCWMSEFVAKSRDILDGGVLAGDADKSLQHIAFLAALFQYMTDPSRSILPQEMTKKLPTLPPANWPFIGELAALVMQETEEQAYKKPRTHILNV